MKSTLRISLPILFSILAFGASAPIAFAATIYVDQNVIGGGTGDGLSQTNATTTIQAAINVASSGDTINVAAGIYTEQITINKSLDLIGTAGKAETTIVAPTTRTGGVTRSTNRGTEINDYIVAAYAPSSTIDVRIQGFTIDANGQNKTDGTTRLDGVFFGDVFDAGGTVAGLFSSTIQNFGSAINNSGVMTEGHSSLTLEDNAISGYTSFGIDADGNFSPGSDPNVTIHNNALTGSNAGYGVLVFGGGIATIKGNNISGNTRTSPTGYGVLISNSDNITIGGSDSGDINQVHNNFIGIELDIANNTTIIGNTLTNNVDRAIQLSDSDNNTVSSNTITGPSAGTDITGIGLSSGSTLNTIGGNTSAARNTITMATSGTGLLYAIYMQSDVGTGSNTIKYNTIVGGKRAIQFDGPPGITGLTTVANNTISNQGFGGILAYNNGDLTITDNTLTNTVRPMEFFGPHNLTITGNTIDGSTYDGINLGNFSGIGNVDGNTIHGIADNNGIRAQASGTKLDITSNIVYGISGSNGSGRGIQIDVAAKNANINSNEIHDITGYAGIVINGDPVNGYATGAKIDNNYVYNCVQGVSANAQTAEFKNNRISSNEYGVDLNAGGAVFVLLNNDISGNNTSSDSYNLGMWAGTANAVNNWWGSATGPAAGTILGNVGDIVFSPWYKNAAMTMLTDGTTITATNATYTSPTDGQADLPTGATDVVLTNDTVLNIASSVNTASGGNITVGGTSLALNGGIVPSVDLSTPQTVGGQPVNITRAVQLSSGTPSVPITLTNSALSNVSASIPDGTKILAPSGWDGTITPPKASSASGDTTPSGFSIGNSVISVGSSDVILLFDKPVTLMLSGVTGPVGYKPANSTAWTQITNTCGTDYDNPINPTFPGECAISNGTDTKILTYHFTTFGGFTIVPPIITPNSAIFKGSVDVTMDTAAGTTIHYTTDDSAPTCSSATYTGTLTFTALSTILKAVRCDGTSTSAVSKASFGLDSRGGGGGGTTVTAAAPAVSAAPAVTSAPAAAPAAPAAPAQGQVLGAAAYNFTKNLKVGSRNADVTALQQLLIDSGYSLPNGATGYFGAQTKTAVKAFQKARGVAQAGTVGPLTRAELNKGVITATPETSNSGLSAGQASAIVGLLQSFGADVATIANVKAALGL